MIQILKPGFHILAGMVAVAATAVVRALIKGHKGSDGGVYFSSPPQKRHLIILNRCFL